jgi:hypothetical protein
LAEADIFLSHLSAENACESKAFMTALAARCPAVLRNGVHTAPLQESEHFIGSDDSHASVRRLEQIIADGRLDQIAAAGRLWYERFADWNVIARKFHETISQQGLIKGDCLICRENPSLEETRLQAAGACVHQTA